MLCEKETKERVISYWAKRSDGFLEQRRAELHSVLAKRWMEELGKYLPKEKMLNILDVGCGAGFFSILLAKEGHHVTGIDLTPPMIKHAKRLAAEELSEEKAGGCRFFVMDAEDLRFLDKTFDVVISRNLTWTLPRADVAYTQWKRVLKVSGLLINADADYGEDSFASRAMLPDKHAHYKLEEDMLEECEKIKSRMPISGCRRPYWDVKLLEGLQMEVLTADCSISSRIFKEKDEFYNPAPMFLVCAKL